MNSILLQYVCLPCAIALTLLGVLVKLNEWGVNPLGELFARYRRLPRFAQFLVPVLVSQLIVYGSTKAPTNDVPGSGSAPTNDAPMLTMAWPGPLAPSLPFDSGFTSNELAAGFALWRVGTNETWNFDLMPEAHVVESWRLRGAADDWTVCATTNLGPVAMTTDGRLVTTNGVFTAYDGRLAVVPESNWDLLGTNAPSRAWWTETPWHSTVFTWQNVLLGRATNTPVSVQAEFTREGDFIYRYDLASAGTNLTSKLYYRIRPEDMEWDDRDEDGLSTHDEVTEYHTDPGLADSDGDGLLDQEEVWYYGTDPSVRSVPNEEIVARVVGSATNDNYKWGWQPIPDCPLSTLKLWDGFAADWPEGMTNLVYERTLALGTANGWQHYFLSSKETTAGGWDLRGLVLEWDDGCGCRGTAVESPEGDSLPLAITNSTVTIRLWATSPKIRCPKPMYLIGYAPAVTISGATAMCDEDGVEQVYFMDPDSTNMTLNVTIDRSFRPCKAPPSAAELTLSGLSNLVSRSDGAMAYAGDENGGSITVTRPGCCRLPAFAIDDPFTPTPRPRLMAGRGGPADDGDGKWIVRLDPSVDYSGKHKFVSTGLEYNEANGDYETEYYYPLDSKCLWRGWQMSEGGYWNCTCEPKVTAGGGADGLPFVEKSYVLNADRTEATGIIKIYGREVWRGTATHSWRDIGSGGGVTTGSELLSGDDDGCGCSCSGGNCDTASGTGLNSVKFRLSLGMPRQEQHSGFVYFESEKPVAVTMGLFEVTHRDDAYVSEVTSGSGRTVTCYDTHGRRVAMTPRAGGVRLTVTVRETGELEDVWDVYNEGGDTNVIRIVQRSRLDNVMSDETYAVDEEGVWSKTDNITGIVETLERIDLLNDPADGKLYETRTTYDADGNQLDRVSTESSRIGLFKNAVLRETYWEQDTGRQVKWRRAEYWNDAAHKDRHGQLKLLAGNCIAWEYHDYDARGFETLRVEQRNGSAVPTAFPEAVAGELLWTSGLADAFVTVFDYTPFAGDDGDPDDVDKVRCETRYVVRNGHATRIARTWTRYTHVYCDGYSGWYDAVKAETWRAASATASRTNPANAYSYVITYSETAEWVPLVMRGEVAEELDENGVLTESKIDEYWDRIETTVRKSNAETYEVVGRDPYFGNELRRATYLADYYELIDEEVSAYDDKNRLRSTTYSDGTSLTNSWSCCRKLWSRDREGRTVLRSAVTGQDRLYYAEEEVWLRELSTNGEHKVTQHFFDGLGREIGTSVYSAAVPGEATVASSSRGKVVSSTSADYPYGGDDCTVAVDARGKMTVSERLDYEDRTESFEDVYARASSAAPRVQTVTTQVRNGARVTETTWDDKWTRVTEAEDYASDGCVVRYETAESSDCGTVTNRIVRLDFLGRTVEEVTPKGTTATTYHGATDREDVTTVTAGDVVRISTAVYDARGEQVGSVQDGVTNRTDEAYEMNADGNWWKVTRSETFDSETVESSSERREQVTGRAGGVISRRIDIDANGVAEETIESFGAAEGERVVSVSNAVSGVTVQTRRFGVSVGLETPDETRQFASDAFGRRVGETRCVDGVSVLPCSETVYNAVGDVVARRSYTNGTEAVTETTAYDTFGRRVSSVDALGNETETRYDAVGNVVEQSGATWPVRYGYDTAGRRVSLSTTKDGRIWNVTRWTYDPATGACTAKRYPDGSQVVYSVTPDGLPLQTTKASQAWSRNAYDAKRRLVGAASSDGAGDAAFAYDAFGKMTAASNGVARYAYARHRGGIVTNEWAHLDGDVQIVRTVDDFGRLSGRGVYDEDFQTISYDGQGRVAAISSGAAAVTYAYGAGGVDAGYALALNGGATVERRVIRDAYRPEQVVAVSNFVNGVAVGGESYVRDAKGRIIEREDGRRETRDTFGYDEVGQVVEVANGQLSSTNCQLRSYAYDQIGNIAGSEALTYTVDGEVTGLGGMAFAYDSASRLTSVSSNGVTIATYAYDAFDRRVRKTTAEATTTYLYDGWNLIREEIAGTNDTTDVIEYFWGKDISGSLDTAGGIGGLLYLKHNGAIYVPLYDASGNVTAYLDAAGNVVVSFTYDAFGNSTVHLHLSPSPYIPAFRYSTKYHDAETGLIYYGYRYYAPTIARWLTRDPLEEQGGLNLHCFCENDGVNRYDALGMTAVDPMLNENLKAIWCTFALTWFGSQGYEISREMLLMALLKDFKGKTYEFPESSNLTRALKNSREYKKIIDNAIDQQPRGYFFHNVSTSTAFQQGDLAYSVGKTDVKFNGEVCKSVRSARVNLRVTFENEYNFDYWDDAEAAKHGRFITWGNNAAYGAQQMGVIHPYWWRATFDEKREWPWTANL